MSSISLSKLYLALIPFALVALGGCVSTVPGARPDDMSAAEHREMASQEEAVAAEHQAQYDPTATVVRAGPAHGPEGTDLDSEYNPTSRHRGQAMAHRRHADAHRAAAEALEHFEAAECRDVPPQLRSSCPLLGQLQSVENIDGGVRLTFPEGVDLDATASRIRCHFAFGRARGYEGMDNCPLYLPGLAVQTNPESNSLDLTAEDAATVDELRRRAATHVEPQESL